MSGCLRHRTGLLGEMMMASAETCEGADKPVGGAAKTLRYRAFLSHNSADKPAVEELARRLEKVGISCFLDKWHLIPGDPWQPALEDALEQSATCVVFCGPSGLGPWQNEEMRAAIAQRVSDPTRAFRVVPVLLPGAHVWLAWSLTLFQGIRVSNRAMPQVSVTPANTSPAPTKADKA